MKAKKVKSVGMVCWGLCCWHCCLRIYSYYDYSGEDGQHFLSNPRALHY